MTTKPTPIRRPERIWHEVRCPHCGRYLCQLAPGSAMRTKCYKCKQPVERTIPESKAA